MAFAPSASEAAAESEESTADPEEAPPQRTSGETAAALEAEGVLPSDLEHCALVLRRLTAASGRVALSGKALRDLRQAAVPFVQAAYPRLLPTRSEQRGATPAELCMKKHQKRQAAADERKRKREHDAKLKAQCKLRAGRLAHLQLLDGMGAGGREATGKGKCQRIPDGPVILPDYPQLCADQENPHAEEKHFAQDQRCYVCKCLFTARHHFYSDLCPVCAALNFEKRDASVDMTGRVCLVTGARVKVGFHVCLKLLRMGARVIGTTRFPDAALKRFKAEGDSSRWLQRLQLWGLDFRFVGAVEKFCAWLVETEDFLDVIINNAAQTIRRPAAYYKSLREAETFKTIWSASHRALPIETGTSPSAPASTPCSSHKVAGPPTSPSFELAAFPPSHGASDGGVDTFLSAISSLVPRTSAEASQLMMLLEDTREDQAEFPAGEVDAQGQQVDLRWKNTWRQKLEEVSGTEALEVLFINVVTPFLLNSRLLPLLRRAPHQDRYIVNVSAMEGKFSRAKTCFHPHTNMAKAALNMMTRTCAEDLASDGNVFMTSVDTGWINDEHPLPAALERAARGFQTPLDEVDAAARVLDPVLEGVRFTSSGGALQMPAKQRRSLGHQAHPAAGPIWGVFLKDYRPTDW